MRRTYPLDHDYGMPLENVRELVGGKAAGLGVMIRELSLPVPPGFVITTATCREYLASGWPAGLDDEIHAGMAILEDAVGRRFGGKDYPLLVSVRSGAPVSMPGMMDTILDLGLTEETVAGLARGTDHEFARACRARLIDAFRSVVAVADVPDDPWVQLRLAIEAVFRSWNSERAAAYRRREGIAEDLGTGVTVQAMVFGNRGPTSATGVAFTRNPSTGEPSLFGDVLFNAQGEDVVAGTHATEPITVLDKRLPEVADELRRAAERLEHHYADLCDIEFTIEDGRLWMLQARVGKRSPQAALRIAIDMAEDPKFPLDREGAVRRVQPLLAHPPRRPIAQSEQTPSILVGLAASPGVASGPIALTADAAIAASAAGRPAAILVRAETSPQDVPGMAKAAGILTARGGLASHAAVVARGWGIPAVVGASMLEVRAGEVIAAGRSLRPQDIITINGSTGEVFEGAVAGASEEVPEAAILRSWAADLNIPVVEAKGQVSARPTDHGGTLPTDGCLRALSTKGTATVDSLADALVSTPETVQLAADELAAQGMVATMAETWSLTDAGRARAARLLEAEREAWGLGNAGVALEGFLGLDSRTKEIVTAWQMRDPQTLNDHSDGRYDGAVLARLAELHHDALAWLAMHEAGCPRLSIYRQRLTRALTRAQAGEQAYVASPRVDSYHGIWFELHEDLIQLAGRSREGETVKGRA